MMFFRFMKKLTKLIGIMRSSRYLQALIHGVAAGVEHERLLALLNCLTVVDIGASRGQFALVARQCFPGANIFSFEPLSEPNRLYRSILSSDSKVRLFPVAIGPEPSEATIHVSGQDDSSSLLPIGVLQSQLFPGTAEKRTEPIRIEPLHAILNESQIETPALLKLDVQGYELEALKGCLRLLHCFSYVYVECSFVELYVGQALADEVIDFVRTQSFKVSGVYNTTYDRSGKAIQADFLFSKSDRKGNETGLASNG